MFPRRTQFLYIDACRARKKNERENSWSITAVGAEKGEEIVTRQYQAYLKTFARYVWVHVCGECKVCVWTNVPTAAYPHVQPCISITHLYCFGARTMSSSYKSHTHTSLMNVPGTYARAHETHLAPTYTAPHVPATHFRMTYDVRILSLCLFFCYF